MAHNDDGQAGQGRRLAVVVLCGVRVVGWCWRERILTTLRSHSADRQRKVNLCVCECRAAAVLFLSRMFAPTVAKAVEQFHPVRCRVTERDRSAEQR